MYFPLKSTTYSGQVAGYTKIGLDYDPATLKVTKVIIEVSGNYPKPVFKNNGTAIQYNLSKLFKDDGSTQVVSKNLNNVYLVDDPEYGLTLPYKIDLVWQ